MDTFGWGPGPAGDLGLLGAGEPSLLIDLDDRTLQCLMGGPSAGFGTSFSGGASGSGGALGEASASAGGKRDAEAAAVDAEDDGEDSDEGNGGGGSGRGGRGRASKKGKSAADAASVKACREKARREKLNECFEELARLCDPSGKMMRTDRISIVQDAIRAMGALRVENNQLKQLNKFLEERVRHLETARAQVMYQQAMLQQQAAAQQQLAMQQVAVQQAHGASVSGAQAAPAGGQPGTATQQQQEQQTGVAPGGSHAGHSEIQPAPSGAEGADETGAQQQQQQQQQQLQRQQSQQVQQPALAPQAQVAVSTAPGPAGMVPPGMMLVPVSAAAGMPGQPGMAAAPAGYGQPFFPFKAEAQAASLAGAAGGSGGMASLQPALSGGFMMPQAMVAGPSTAGPAAAPAAPAAPAMPGLPQVMPANAPPLSWLPAPDISQDQKLRPPAA
ncbi:hypothetical protein ABPG75_010072 [Micractinium tetrahymenae]